MTTTRSPEPAGRVTGPITGPRPRETLFSLDGPTNQAHHLHRSVSLILKARRLAGPGRVLVLGCGRCREIPIGRLVEAAPVSLVDLDRGALQALRGELASSGVPAGRVSFLNEDITGLADPLLDRAREDLGAADDIEAACGILTELLDGAAPVFWTPERPERYRLIVCSLLVTQLQARILSGIDRLLLQRFPDGGEAMAAHSRWIEARFRFAGRLERAFADHLRSLGEEDSVIYVSATARVSFVRRREDGLFSTRGYWRTIGTGRLDDYFASGYSIVERTSWLWFVPRSDHGSDGRLYEVQALLLRPGASA